MIVIILELEKRKMPIIIYSKIFHHTFTQEITNLFIELHEAIKNKQNRYSRHTPHMSPILNIQKTCRNDPQ